MKFDIYNNNVFGGFDMFKLCCLSYDDLLNSGKTVTYRQLLAFIIVISSMVRYITVEVTRIGCCRRLKKTAEDQAHS